VRVHRQQNTPTIRLSHVGGSIGTLLLTTWSVVIGLLVAPHQVLAVLPPTNALCASVDQSGAITITWAAPADPLGEFDQYNFYRATAAEGPFVLAGTAGSLATTSFTDPTADGTTGPHFYYITTLTNGIPALESAPGDTVSTIYLQVFQSTPLGSAVLSWNHLAVPSGATDEFTIWMEYPIGTLQQIGQVPGNTFSFQFEIAICEDSLTFYITRQGQGCTFISNWTGDVFRDQTPPSVPVITAVTVDTSATGLGLASIEWSPSPQADTDGYIVLFDAPAAVVVIDTVWGAGSTTFEWEDSEAILGPESYTVAAFDTCLSGIPPSPNTSATQPFHTTIFLDHAYDLCAGVVELSWSPYVGWDAQEYRILVQVDGSIWASAGAVGGSTTTFQFPVAPFRQYCFVVEAVRVGGSARSLSNKTCVVTDSPGLPTFNYLRNVTVLDENTIQVVDSVDVAAEVSGYRLERSENGGPFEEVMLFGPVTTNLIIYTDTDVVPSTNGYRYRMVVLNACGDDALTSNLGSSILLSAVPDLHGVNILTWNGYQSWDGTIGGHIVHRQVADGPMVPIQALSSFPWTYVDDVSALTSTTGRFCYFVEALEAGNGAGINAISRSNTVCAVQEELVYIPNAFMIGGNNPLFRPQLAFADVADYELVIINRWGQVFWSTTDPEQGWDGTASGRAVPLGIYAYYCRFRNGAGREFEKRGTVTMLTAVD
jgi:hypothetical protein